jgi:hypothetical protein
MNKTADNPTGPAFVVFGIGADKKPRAARFDDSQPKLVAKAAELMNLKLREINSPALANLAKQLPIGRLYANGNGFVPPVQKQLYATLAATVAAASRNAATEAADGAPRSPGLPRSWDEIAPGHLVIANEGIGDGWWEAIVVEVKGDMLTLHWRDYPWQPDIIQHRSNVALIEPAQ